MTCKQGTRGIYLKLKGKGWQLREEEGERERDYSSRKVS